MQTIMASMASQKVVHANTPAVWDCPDARSLSTFAGVQNWECGTLSWSVRSLPASCSACWPASNSSSAVSCTPCFSCSTELCKLHGAIPQACVAWLSWWQ